jgi:lysophospholipase L1-like esterase
LRAYDLGLAANGEVDFAAIGQRIEPPDRIAEEIARHESDFLPGFAERVSALVAESRAAGIEPILITQPALYGEGIDPTTGRELGELDVFGTSSALKWRLLELYNDATRRVAADESVLLIDVAHKLPKDSRLYWDFIHYSPAGAAEFAAIVANELEARSAPSW